VRRSDLPASLALVPVENIHPGPLQPRTTVSVELVRELAASMRSGRHEPLLEVEPSPIERGHYQVVCGEQRWRAAKEAGLERVLVRVLDGLDYIARLRKQHEENSLRADLTPADDAHLVLTMKRLKDIQVAERLLTRAGVAFERLSNKQVKDQRELADHLDVLKALLLENKINVVSSGSGLAVAPLSPWRETEAALGISEAARKRKLAVLRLPPDILAEANALPANHAPLIAQVDDHQRRAQLVEYAPYLTNRQLQVAVRRLRADSSLSVDAALKRTPAHGDDPLGFEMQLRQLADLCRQIARLLGNLWPRISEVERDEARRVLKTLANAIRKFQEAA